MKINFYAQNICLSVPMNKVMKAHLTLQSPLKLQQKTFFKKPNKAMLIFSSPEPLVDVRRASSTIASKDFSS